MYKNPGEATAPLPTPMGGLDPFFNSSTIFFFFFANVNKRL